MNRIGFGLILCVALLGIGGPAHADLDDGARNLGRTERFALDYAPTQTCIDAARFADEVSARLGYVPWDDRAVATVHVRVDRSGEGFVGSLTGPDGGSRQLRGASCTEVTSLLAVAVASLLDPAPPRPRPAGPTERESEADLVEINIGSNDGVRYDVSVLVGGGTGRSLEGVHLVGTSFYEPLCTSPCTVRVPRGRRYFSLVDPDRRAEGHGYVVLDTAANLMIHRESRATTRRLAFVSGLLVTAGGIAGGWLLDDPAVRITSLTVGLGVGLGLLGGSLYADDRLAMTRAP